MSSPSASSTAAPSAPTRVNVRCTTRLISPPRSSPSRATSVWMAITSSSFSLLGTWFSRLHRLGCGPAERCSLSGQSLFRARFYIQT
eukprot:m.939369 g.939369  ORF g.939369 m.939369 type:complete len:87 (-) comp242351_c0_seq1:63-323(-)